MRNLIYGHDVLDQNMSTWLDEYSNKESKKTRLVITLSALGIILFLTSALFLPFKDKLFNLLYPKSSSQASFCSSSSLISAAKQGFVYTGGDLSQETEALNTSLYYSHDASLGPNKQVYMIGKYASNYADPLGLSLLMGDNLSNIDFKGLGGRSPAGWTFLTAGGSGAATVETSRDYVLNSQTSVKITNHKSPSGTQISQVFKENVSEGDLVIFGAWVKTSDPASVKLFLQEDKAPFKEFGQIVTTIQPQKWSFVLGYGRVPASMTNFQVVLRVTGQESTAWFDHPVAAVINGKASQQLTKLVVERCGSAWFIDNEPGVDSTTDPYVMEPIPAEVYALTYRHFYQVIKEIDSQALVLPGGLAWVPEGSAGYSSKAFLDQWRSAYAGFFGTQPPLDAMNIHYLATDSKRWSSTTDLESYLSWLHDYMEEIPEWKGKPVWISELGVSSSAPKGGIDFAKASLKLLENNLNVAKWFWFDTCAFDSKLASLFESKGKVCTWPVKLTSLGEGYVLPKLAASPAPSIAPVSVSTPSAQVSATPAATLRPTTAPTTVPVSTASATLATPKPAESTASTSAQNQ